MGWYEGEGPANLRRFPVEDGEYYLYDTVCVIGEVRIGRFTYLGGHGFVAGRTPVEIGSFCSIASNFSCVTHAVAVVDRPCAYPLFEVLGVACTSGSELPNVDAPAALSERPITIGNDVWVGDSVSVVGGTSIADGCVIGSKSVVRGETVPYGVYVGNPARLIRLRFPEPVIEQLLALRWWEWPVEKLRANAAFFGTDLTAFEGCLSELVMEPVELG
jgi:virginiamycin A acetyltransferase